MPLFLLDGEDASAFAARLQKVFKMLKAAGGSEPGPDGAPSGLTANFFLASGKDDYTLVAHLTKKDKAGAKTLTDGKKARKAIPGSKWARGLIRWDGQRFVFEVAAGNLSASLARSVVRGQLATDAKLGDLKKALFIVPGDPSPPPETPEAPETEDASRSETSETEDTIAWELTAEEQEELDALTQDGDLSAMRTSLQHFLSLSEEDAQQQLREQVEQISSLLSQIQASPEDESLGLQLAQAHEQILALADFGPDVFAEVPGIMEEVGQILSLTAMGMGREATEQRLKAINDDFQAYLASASADTPLSELVARQALFERLRDNILDTLEGDAG